MQLAISRGEPFYGGELGPIHLYGEQETRSHGFAVYEHCACATDAVLAPNVGARQPELVPQKVGEQEARFNFANVRSAVDRDRYSNRGHGQRIALVQGNRNREGPGKGKGEREKGKGKREKEKESVAEFTLDASRASCAIAPDRYR